MYFILGCEIIGKYYYHKYNYLKYRVLLFLYKGYPESSTARQIAEELGIKRQQAADLLSRWHRKSYGYTKRVKVKGSKAYSFKITEVGTRTLYKYQKRIDEKISLNLKVVKKEESYMGVSKLGTEQGLKIEDAIKEMKRRKETKNVDEK